MRLCELLSNKAVMAVLKALFFSPRVQIPSAGYFHDL